LSTFTSRKYHKTAVNNKRSAEFVAIDNPVIIISRPKYIGCLTVEYIPFFFNVPPCGGEGNGERLSLFKSARLLTATTSPPKSNPGPPLETSTNYE
jgi:hypothetical protein